jgi:two-component system alkaline phosphatase synthesis response regulator PhoP
MNVETAKKILMVEDDSDLATLVGFYLKLANYEIFHVINGDEAKKQVETQQFDLIILDLMMPVLDGISFLRWLRNERKLETQVLVLTARVKSDIKTKTEALGVSDIVFKPVEPEKLVEKVKKMLG